MDVVESSGGVTNAVDCSDAVGSVDVVCDVHALGP